MSRPYQITPLLTSLAKLKSADSDNFGAKISTLKLMLLGLRLFLNGKSETSNHLRNDSPFWRSVLITGRIFEKQTYHCYVKMQKK
jgi:hypothetical protein